MGLPRKLSSASWNRPLSLALEIFAPAIFPLESGIARRAVRRADSVSLVRRMARALDLRSLAHARKMGALPFSFSRSPPLPHRGRNLSRSRRLHNPASPLSCRIVPPRRGLDRSRLRPLLLAQRRNPHGPAFTLLCTVAHPATTGDGPCASANSLGRCGSRIRCYTPQWILPGDLPRHLRVWRSPGACPESCHQRFRGYCASDGRCEGCSKRTAWRKLQSLAAGPPAQCAVSSSRVRATKSVFSTSTSPGKSLAAAG